MSRRKRRRRRSKPVNADLVPIQSPAADGKPSPSVPAEAGVGDVFDDPRRVRSDARMVIRLMRLGCLTEQQVEALIQKCAATAAQADNPRDLNATVRTLQQFAKLQLECVRIEREAEPRRVAHAHIHRTESTEPTLESIRSKLGLKA